MTDQITQPINPLLQTLKTRIPGETFRLPSQGLFYTNGELSDDVVNGEVHVFPVTTMDEITLKTPDKLLSGKAVNEVFARCIPQVKKPMDLLSKDVDYLLMCLRLISYGDTVAIEFKHTCENAARHHYEVELRPLILKSKQIDPTTIGIKYTITMGSGQIVELRPPLYGGILKMYLSDFDANRLTADERDIEYQNQLVDIIVSTIISVDRITDKNMIAEWVKALPAGEGKRIGTAMKEAGDWGPSTEWTTKCKDCGEEVTLEIPLNPISFFS